MTYSIGEIEELSGVKSHILRYWEEVIPVGDFPKLLKLEPNVDYVRDILARTAENKKRKGADLNGEKETFL